MDLHRHPDLLDRLAAAYALGTLRGGARRRFEALARQSAAVRASALLWQERFAAMMELQRADAPSANVWKRIEIQLAAQQASRAPAVETAKPWRGVAAWWRGAALAGAFASVAAVSAALFFGGQVRERDIALAQSNQTRLAMAAQNATLASRLEAQPDVRYVAVLSDEKSTASMLVTFDPRHNTLTIKRVGGFQEAADKSLQLWALPEGAGPRSLGVLGNEGIARIPTAQEQVRQVPLLAVSLEPKGGVPPGSGPSGPVLFKGAFLQAP